jgi:NifU-like protein involved in Fe-S cluster formation
MSAVADPYNPTTRQLFADPAHAGDLQNDYAQSAQAEASESAAGAKIQLAAGLADGRLQECRFRVFGCPHLLAAAEWLCNQYEGATLADLAGFRAAACMGPLAIPVEKTGRILLLEDAIRLLVKQLEND